MGGKGKKRKTEDNSNHSENSSQNQSVTDQHAVSFALSEANNVLYGAPGGNEPISPENVPYSSTPLPNGGVSMNSQFAETHRKLDSIMHKLKKLDVIEERMNKLDSRMGSLESRVVDTEKKNVEFERSVKFVSEKCDEFQSKYADIKGVAKTLNKQKNEISELATIIDRQKNEFEKLQGEMEKITENREDLEEAVLDLRCRSMKYNLVFTGLGGENREENTERKLREFIFHELGIEGHIEFVNVHRFGRYVREKCRPIVARFVYNKDRDDVLASTYKLKGKPFGVHEQFPKEVEDRRRQLYPIVKDLKKSGNSNVKLVRDKLYVNGKLYDPKERKMECDTVIQPVTSVADQQIRR